MFASLFGKGGGRDHTGKGAFLLPLSFFSGPGPIQAVTDKAKAVLGKSHAETVTKIK